MRKMISLGTIQISSIESNQIECYIPAYGNRVKFKVDSSDLLELCQQFGKNLRIFCEVVEDAV